MNRRKFLKILGFTTLFPNEILKMITNAEAKSLTFKNNHQLINEILLNWNYKKAKLKKPLTLNQFLTFRKFIKQIQKENINPKLKNDLTYIYAKIKYPYLTYLTKIKIQQLLPKLNSCDQRVIKKIRNTKIINGTINFNQINENYTKALKSFSARHHINIQIPLILSIIENNYGWVVISNSNALGPLQIKPETIKDMETIYHLKPPYKKLKHKSERFWREIETSILYIKYIIDLLKLDITQTKLPIVDLIVLSLCYKEGIDMIIENFKTNKEYSKPAIQYICEVLTIYKYKFIY